MVKNWCDVLHRVTTNAGTSDPDSPSSEIGSGRISHSAGGRRRQLSLRRKSSGRTPHSASGTEIELGARESEALYTEMKD